MKQDKIYFKCDNKRCKNEIVIEQKLGFPYNLGWFYLHEFSGKYSPLRNSGTKNYEERDKHFCGLKCHKEFINILLEQPSLKEVVKNEEKGDINWEKKFDGGK